MPHTLGILFALGALCSWAIGDLFIQRGTRTVGNWKTLFFIELAGSIVLFPFVIDELPSLTLQNILLLTLLSIVALFAALFLFEGLRKGKFAVIEPIFGLELPFTVGFSIVLGGERLPPLLYFFSSIVFLGLLLTAASHLEYLHLQRTAFERGAIFTGMGAIGMGLVNFLTGLGSQQTSPLLTIWFSSVFLAGTCFLYLLITGEWRSLLKDFQSHSTMITTFSIIDNLAWIFYAASMAIIPISIATTVSESYIALSVILGIFVNHERLKKHQILGILLILTGLLLLSSYVI